MTVMSPTRCLRLRLQLHYAYPEGAEVAGPKFDVWLRCRLRTQSFRFTFWSVTAPCTRGCLTLLSPGTTMAP